MIDLHKDFKTEGADLDNILTLRDVRDADKIVAAMADCKQAGGKVGIRSPMFTPSGRCDCTEATQGNVPLLSMHDHLAETCQE